MHVYRITVLIICLITSAVLSSVAQTGFPAPGMNKVAYYVFDSGGPDRYPMTTFSDEANIVIVFEGTLWELADSAHYATTWMRNVNYHSHAEVLRDIRALQARGVKVLMNVDDAASWSTPTPFTTYDGKGLSITEFAAFVKTCAIDSVRLDGIALDIEHGATANAEYVALLKELGTYFGPRSSNAATQMYTAAIYAGGAPGPVIGKSKDITSYMNFVMDMAYFTMDYAARFRQWADSIGTAKVMVGVLNDNYDVTRASAAAAWQPAVPPKAGIMVYAANNLKSYTDAVFRSLVVGPSQAARPFPEDSAKNVSVSAVLRWKKDPSVTAYRIYCGADGALEWKGEQTDTTMDPGPLLPNSEYIWRVDQKNAVGTTIGKVWTFATGSSTDVRPEGGVLPMRTALLQNYPNPFNPVSDIRYQLSSISIVRLSVYDLLGREVAVLVNEAKAPGWHQVRFDATGLASGVYLYRLHARPPDATSGSGTTYVATGKCLLVR